MVNQRGYGARVRLKKSSAGKVNDFPDKYEHGPILFKNRSIGLAE